MEARLIGVVGAVQVRNNETATTVTRIPFPIVNNQYQRT
jgi:hypothetical protein